MQRNLAGKPLLSIVCPAYQEEDCLPYFHTELTAVLDRVGADFAVEILYVDDGSRDGTLAILKGLASKDARVRYLSLSRNFGQQAALTAGLEHARGDLVITMDSDLQHPPAVIPQLLSKWREGYEIVLTIRDEDKRLNLGKRLTSRLFYWVMSLLSDVDIRPARSDFRLLTRRAVAGLLQMHERHRFLRGMVQWLGFPTAEVSFHPDSRKAGQTKYTVRGLFNLASDALFSFSRTPLRLSFYLGFLALASSMLLFFVESLRWLFAGHHANVGIWLLVSTFFLGGCILWSVGMLGEYIGRIYEQVKERPIYLLKDHSPDIEATSSSKREAA
jgi:dolichol-phosphate mannosyltransferase